MNSANLNTKVDNSNNDFVGALSRVMPRKNGTPEQFSALAESLNRSGYNAKYYDRLQENLNEKCLPNPSILTNELKEA